MQPKVSVVIPVYNVEKYLRECLDSVVNQTLKDIEIICVDDGSTDNSGQILSEYAEKDKRIKVIHKENGGYGKAMNIGMDNATGEYIGIVEPDDFVELDMYEKLYNTAKENNSDIVKAPFFNFFAFSNQEFPVDWSISEIPEDVFTIKECSYFLYTHPSIWSCIYRHNFLVSNKIRFVEPKGAGWADNPFQVQTMCLAKKIKFLNTPFYHYRKLNRDESDDLKDYKIPFERSVEIHTWLDDNHIDDENILAHLYKRELAYIHIVLGMKNITDNEDCHKRIKEMSARWKDIVIKESPYITKYEKHAMENLKLGSMFTFILWKERRLLLKRLRPIRRYLLSINITKNRKIFQFLGIQYSTGTPNNRPAWLKIHLQ